MPIMLALPSGPTGTDHLLIPQIVVVAFVLVVILWLRVDALPALNVISAGGVDAPSFVAETGYDEVMHLGCLIFPSHRYVF